MRQMRADALGAPGSVRCARTSSVISNLERKEGKGHREKREGENNAAGLHRVALRRIALCCDALLCVVLRCCVVRGAALSCAQLCSVVLSCARLLSVVLSCVCTRCSEVY